MAWTVTRDKAVSGNKRVVYLKLTADAATQTVESGLKLIQHMNWSFGSYATNANGPKIIANSNASGVNSNGVLGCSGFTTGDDIYVTVYGLG